jgi:uncharacterized protein
MTPLPQHDLNEALRHVPYETPFITLSGAHLYGFPSPDSDFDLRGSHLLPGTDFWGLKEPRETLELACETPAGLVEIVTHDLRKFLRLLLKRNGYVLEQLTSPLVIRTSPVHSGLLDLVPGVLTRNHYHHYRGFYHNERKEYERSQPRSVKELLYCYRVLMTGIVLLREQRVEANLPALNARFGLSFLTELIEIKSAGERVGIPNDTPYTAELLRLEGELDAAFEESDLPEEPSVRGEIEALLVRARST